MGYDGEVRRHIEQYLETVAVHLRAAPGDESSEILRSLESHLYEALDRRAGDAATVEDVDAILAEMDPPEPYARDPASRKDPGRPKRNGHPLGPWALALFIGGLILPLVLAAFAVMLCEDPSARGQVFQIAAILGVGLELLALVLGYLSRSDKRGKAAVVAISISFLVLLPSAIALRSLATTPPGYTEGHGKGAIDTLALLVLTLELVGLVVGCLAWHKRVGRAITLSLGVLALIAVVSIPVILWRREEERKQDRRRAIQHIERILRARRRRFRSRAWPATRPTGSAETHRSASK